MWPPTWQLACGRKPGLVWREGPPIPFSEASGPLPARLLPPEVHAAGRIWRLTMGDFLMPVPAPSALLQGLGHLQQQDPPQQLHQPHRDGAAAAGRGPGADGGALPGAQDQAGALPAAAHLREGRHRRE